MDNKFEEINFSVLSYASEIEIIKEKLLNYTKIHLVLYIIRSTKCRKIICTNCIGTNFNSIFD